MKIIQFGVGAIGAGTVLGLLSKIGKVTIVAKSPERARQLNGKKITVETISTKGGKSVKKFRLRNVVGPDDRRLSEIFCQDEPIVIATAVKVENLKIVAEVISPFNWTRCMGLNISIEGMADSSALV